MQGVMSGKGLKCRSHAELVSASHKTLKQVQGDGTMFASQLRSKRHFQTT